MERFSDDQINDKMSAIERSLGPENRTGYCRSMEARGISTRDQICTILTEEQSLDRMSNLVNLENQTNLDSKDSKCDTESDSEL